MRDDHDFSRAKRARDVAHLSELQATGTTFTRWDPVDELKTEADQAMYLDACKAADPGDGSLARAALDDMARAKAR